MRTIIPAQSVDSFQLAWSYNDLIRHLSDSFYEVERKESVWIVSYSYYKFWICLPELILYQIGIYPNDEIFFMGIGFGDTLRDIEEKIGIWQEYYDLYILPTYQGIAFELADNSMDEEWIESEAPISAIYVFLPKKEDNESVL